jgi:hypothetical protein
VALPKCHLLFALLPHCAPQVPERLSLLWQQPIIGLYSMLPFTLISGSNFKSFSCIEQEQVLALVLLSSCWSIRQDSSLSNPNASQSHMYIMNVFEKIRAVYKCTQSELNGAFRNA